MGVDVQNPNQSRDADLITDRACPDSGQWSGCLWLPSFPFLLPIRTGSLVPPNHSLRACPRAPSSPHR